jgi:hypothetical protein
MIPFNSFQINGIKNLLEQNKNGDEEVEFKVRTFTPNGFQSVIPKQYFNNLFSHFSSTSIIPFIEKSIITNYSDNNNNTYRHIDIKEASDKKIGEIFNFKKQQERLDFNFYFLELRLTRSIDKTISKSEFTNVKKTKTIQRNRVRYIYKLSPDIELHLSVIMLNEEITYEAEFEILPKLTTIDKIISILNQYIKIMSNINYLPTDEEVKNLISQYNMLIKDPSNLYYRNELIDIKLSDIKDMKNYNISNKLDGHQYYLLFLNSTLYSFNPLQINRPHIEPESLKIYRDNIPSELSHTLIASELVDVNYNIFDVIVYKKKNVENLKFTDRLKYISLILKSFTTNLNLLEKPFITGNLYFIMLKEILYMYNKYGKNVMDKNDGMIFIPENEPYINNKSKKYKFWQRRSIDVGLTKGITTKIEGKEKKIFKMYVMVKRNKEFFSIETTNIIEVDNTFPEYNKLKDNVIVEIRYLTSEKKIVIDRLRPDKVFPNSKFTAEAVRQDILNPIYLIPLLEEMKKYYPLSEQEKSEINESEILKIAQEWDNIKIEKEENIKIEKEENKENKEDKNEKKEDFTRMRKYHNQVKTKLINNTIGKTKKKLVDVIDIGGGKLGDITKYYETDKINRIYVIEPNKEYIKEGEKRIDTLINDKKIKLNPKAKTNTIIINQPLQNVKEIKISNKVDFISSFFSLTFLFSSETDVDILVKFILDKLLDNGFFIGTTMDGFKTRNLLDEERGKVSFNKEEIIIRLYNPDEKMNYGDKIELKLDTATVSKQIESLVYFNLLVAKLEKQNIKLVKSDFFNPSANKEIKLSQNEELLSTLNRYFIFKKEISIKDELEMLKENEIKTFDNKIDPNVQLVRVGTLGENHCFYHAYMYSTSSKYRNSSHEEKRKMVFSKRKEISESVTLDDYKEEGNGQTLIAEFLDYARTNLNIPDDKFDEFNKLVDSKSADEFLKKFKKKLIKDDYDEKQIPEIINNIIDTLLENFKELIGKCQITHAVIPLLMRKLNINIIMINDKTRNIYNLLVDKYNDKNLYIIMLNLGNYHYESCGILYTDKNNNALIDYVLFHTEQFVIDSLKFNKE